MLRIASAQRCIVWCQIGFCSFPAFASVHPVNVAQGSFDTSGGRETETVEKTGQSSARQIGSPSLQSRGHLSSGEVLT